MSLYSKEYKLDEITVNKNAVVSGKNYRISILTESLLRLEYSEEGIFEDRATQAVLNRNFEVPNFSVYEKDGILTIKTSKIKLEYNQKDFSSNGLSIQAIGNFSHYKSTWYYGTDFIDLKGTARTLDKANGEVPLSKGIISKNGFSVYDDSKSLILTEDGWVEPRKYNNKDIYFFGYGHDYKECLKDFYKLCGNMPLLPRYALGNWWSRYHKYTENEYKELIERFESNNIPFSVAVMDMDWHLTDIDPKYGSGWTGYTWNKELFPNPKEFMTWLHNKGLKITLNVHPAAGLRAFEDNYIDMAKELNKDWENEETIEFDIADKKFLEAYFKYMHHPNEEDGVDFWWIDWQQQSHTKIEGLDPLWMLNHYHYYDSLRNGKRGLTFSRYAGIGSHRYPIGFSGDTYITWESLDFQPYFTSTASNVGYGWWSHDIGGHMLGKRDDELAVRWVQFGVFSPINRLHSSDNPFAGKEPWNFNMEAEFIMKKYLKLRHKLIPYIYTMNKYASEDGRPLMLPMYYEYADDNNAYTVPNQYYFGTEMIVAPITKPLNKESVTANVNVWLPEGLWYDFFNGRKYIGGYTRKIYRGIDNIPVFVKAGGIITLSENNSIKNPESLRVKVFAGDNGKFTLWEDDGDSAINTNENWVSREFTLNWNENPEFIISSASGNFDVIPENRKIIIEFIGSKSEIEGIYINGESINSFNVNINDYTMEIELPYIDNNSEIKICLKNNALSENNIEKEVMKYLMSSHIEYSKKVEILNHIRNINMKEQLISTLYAMNIDSDVYGTLIEIIS